jgi:uncharacterized NAD(P)/FAD-binding protein YdhS
MSIFERLQKRLEVDKHEEGISPLDIADLPPNLRKIMRLMLREVEMTDVELHQAVGEMPVTDRMSAAALDQALDELTRQFWLIRRGLGERVTYQVNLRRKSGSRIAQGVWNVLDSKIGEAKK